MGPFSTTLDMVTETTAAPHAVPRPASPRGGRALAACLVTAGLGVLSGFAVFFLALEDQTQLRFFEILGTATLLSIVVEWLREVIDEDGRERAQRGPRWSGILVSLLIVGLSELFALGWHAGISLYGTDDFNAAVTIIEGGTQSPTYAPLSGLLWLGILWLVSGMALGAALSFTIGRSMKSVRERMSSGALTGCLVGGLLAPIALLAFLLIVNFGHGVVLLVFQPADWTANFHILQASVSTMGTPGLVIGAVLWVADQALTFLGRFTDRAPLIVVALMIGGGIIGIREKAGPIAWLGVFAGIALTMTALVPSLGGLFLLLVRTGLIWAIPGIVLGALVPLLERPAEVPKWWSSVAFAAAIMLVVITASRLEGRWWLLVPAAGVFATGIFVWRTGQVQACWPMLAVSVATIVCGVVIALQHFATFGAVLSDTYDLSHLPDRISIAFPADTSAASATASITDIVRQSGIGHPFPDSKEIAATAAAEEKRRLDRAASLSDLGTKIDATSSRTAEWTDTLTDMQETMARHWSTTTDTSTNTSTTTDNPPAFRQRLADVVEVQRKLTELDKDVTKALAHTREIRTALDDVRKNADTDAVSAFSQQLSDRLTPYERDLEAFVVGTPERGGFQAFKAQFNAFAGGVYLDVCQWLELGLAGSFGFWTTLGLLAAWALRRDAHAA
jgi:hypothetical protein